VAKRGECSFESAEEGGEGIAIVGGFVIFVSGCFVPFHASCEEMMQVMRNFRSVMGDSRGLGQRAEVARVVRWQSWHISLMVAVGLLCGAV
jgi:hypothetical protein